MKIAFVSQIDSKNIHSWSGTPYHMVTSLKSKGHDVVEIGPLLVPFHNLLKLVNKILNILTGRYYDYHRSEFVAKSYANQVKQHLENQSFDLILCPSSIPCAYLVTDKPIITWEDATFAGLVGYHLRGWKKLSSIAIKHGNALQQRALNNATLAIFSSDWAANSALLNYQVDSADVKVIPFGANLLNASSQAQTIKAIENRSKTECHLLFIGVDWYGKGGDLVIQTAKMLQEKGIKVIVDIVGCEPPNGLPDFVQCHGFISKSNADGNEKLQNLLLNSHFLFVPSLAECYGIVFAEASACGVPSLARATGGIPTVIRNGANGYAFSCEATAKDYAEYVAKEFLDYENYQVSAYKARREFENRLNWDSAITCFEALVREIR